jgi:D-galactose 1-dehydrogenase
LEHMPVMSGPRGAHRDARNRTDKCSVISLAVVSVGKIVREQHLPAIAVNPRFNLVATASRNASLDDVSSYRDIAALLASEPSIDAVSLCAPPRGRYDMARVALKAGKHVMLEKPPGASTGEVRDLEAIAKAQGVTLFTSWHSREAAGVPPARDWLQDRKVRSVRVDWKEDVRVWHPGQAWIFEAGGLGVFDPGINALSILTAILPGRLVLKDATLAVPANKAAPIAANLQFLLDGNAPVLAEFDFLQTGPQTWDIAVETDAGTLKLSRGGSTLDIDGTRVIETEDREYRNLYERFADLISNGESDVDLMPLNLVADAFLLGSRTVVDPFFE